MKLNVSKSSERRIDLSIFGPEVENYQVSDFTTQDTSACKILDVTLHWLKRGEHYALRARIRSLPQLIGLFSTQYISINAQMNNADRLTYDSRLKIPERCRNLTNRFMVESIASDNGWRSST